MDKIKDKETGISIRFVQSFGDFCAVCRRWGAHDCALKPPAVVMCGCAGWLTCGHPWPQTIRTSFAPSDQVSENHRTE